MLLLLHQKRQLLRVLALERAQLCQRSRVVLDLLLDLLGRLDAEPRRDLAPDTDGNAPGRAAQDAAKNVQARVEKRAGKSVPLHESITFKAISDGFQAENARFAHHHQNGADAAIAAMTMDAKTIQFWRRQRGPR